MSNRNQMTQVNRYGGLACLAAMLCCAATCWTLAATTVRADEPAAEAKPAESKPADAKVPDGAKAADAKAPDVAAQVDRLIKLLGDDDYFIRERAQADLAKIGFEAFDTLEAAQDNDDIEIASRAKFLIGQLQIEWTIESDPPEVKKLLQGYGLKDDPARLALLEELAKLPDDRGLAVLCRLVRFDRKLVLSKLAAMAIIEKKLTDDAQWNARERLIVENLGRSPRAGAEWLRAYLLSHKDAAAGAERWGALAAAEEQSLSQQPQETQLDLVRGLWRQQIALWKKLDRRDETVAAMMRVVNLEEGTSEALAELLDWLFREQAWKVIDTVVERFNDRIQREPALLYTVARAQLEQHKEELANQTAEKALKVESRSPEDRFFRAEDLRKHGLIKWAQQELRQVIETGRPQEKTFAQRMLSEQLHDLGDDLAAAELRDEVVKAMGPAAAPRAVDDDPDESGPAPQQARAHFFRSCHHLAKGDRDAQLKELKAALGADPTDADVLIALYRYPNLDAEFKTKVVDHIRKTADMFRGQMQKDPEDPQFYNQFAWLVANTEGDKKAALDASLKSLELSEGDTRGVEAGFLDTLGRCYYALGDYENAVKRQSRAVEIDPHSGLMNKQLALFKEALAKANEKSK
jgi:tetratricopeptide (TPR) repeat protein